MIKTIGLVLAVILLGVPGSEATNVRFPEMAGWKPPGEIQSFVPETLYEYINGAADIDPACDFEELQVAEYGNEKKAAVTVEVYRRKTPKVPLESAARNASRREIPSASGPKAVSTRTF
jgi:hypothetical protein